VFVLSNLVAAVARLLYLALEVYFWIIVARVVLSFVNPDPFNPVVRFLHRVTEPVLRAVRLRLPTVHMGFDLSPMVVLIGLKLVEWVVVDSLRDLALRLR
jgi:YggT family protein